MSKGMPSLLALLGLAAVAGFQNRDKISDMMRGAGTGDPARSPGPAPAQPPRTRAGSWGRSARHSAPAAPAAAFLKASANS